MVFITIVIGAFVNQLTSLGGPTLYAIELGVQSLKVALEDHPT